MIKLVVRVDNLEHLEALIGVAKTLDLQVDLGVEAPPLPSKRRAGPSTKGGKKSRKQRHASKMKVRLAKLPKKSAPRLKEVHDALKLEFGSRAFDKSLAKGVARERAEMAHPSSYITKLMDVGAMVPA